MLSRDREAVAALDRAIALDSRFVSAYNSRGASYFDDGNYQRAMDDLNKAIELDGQNHIAYALRGAALRMLKHYSESRVALHKAIALNPRYSFAYYQLAALDSAEGRYDEAVDDYDKALGVDPHYKFGYEKAFALRKLKRYSEALHALDQATAIDPQWNWPYVERASIYHDELFQYEQAYQSLKKFSELNKSGAFESDLAEAALTSGRFQEAYDLASKLLAKNENTDTNTFSVDERCAVRLIGISALLLQGYTTRAKQRLEEFITYFRSAANGLERQWDYSGTRNFVAQRAMDGPSKRIILNLIKLLQVRPQVRIERIEELVSTLGLESSALLTKESSPTIALNEICTTSCAIAKFLSSPQTPPISPNSLN